jgi:hypothetical protein
LLRRSVPVPGILATHRPGAIMVSLGASLLFVPTETTSQLLTKRKPAHTQKS